jgi:ABC-type sugar transport system ATPase subunit
LKIGWCDSCNALAACLRTLSTQITQERSTAAAVEDKHIRRNISHQIYQATMHREKKRMLQALAKLEDRAAQLEARTANMSGVISFLSAENQRKDEQIARFSGAVKRKDKMIDAMQCASALIQLHHS